MPNLQKDHVFQLIKTLGKGEKRNFKLYMQRNNARAELKVVQLFDAIDKMDEYDEQALIHKNSSLKKSQLSNLKSNLYRHILASLRVLKETEHADMALHEMLDNARLLYNKGLYLQCLHALERVKQEAYGIHQFSFVQQALFFEKKIEAMYITRSMRNRAEELTAEAQRVATILSGINERSNMNLLLYSWYIQNGHARNREDSEAVDAFVKKYNLGEPPATANFYEKLYHYQSMCWVHFIQLDFLKYYRSAQKWIDLFHKEPAMIAVETIQYTKGLHNLVSACYDLRIYDKFLHYLGVFGEFYYSDAVQQSPNYRIQAFIYYYTARIHQYYLEGRFTEGLEIVPEIMEGLEEYDTLIDRHRVLVFYYKIASLYFGAARYEEAIDYLNRIIQLNADLRIDLQCYARLLHLISHVELDNWQIVPYLLKSVYRFMAKMHHMNLVEQEMFRFIRQAINQDEKGLAQRMRKLLDTLRPLQAIQTESRAFAYLDIISWLESKLENIPVEQVIRRKFLKRIETHQLKSMHTHAARQ